MGPWNAFLAVPWKNLIYIDNSALVYYVKTETSFIVHIEKIDTLAKRAMVVAKKAQVSLDYMDKTEVREMMPLLC